MPSDAYELDSNPSIAPSQSASQIAYDELLPQHRGGVPFPKLGPSRHGPGSISGSIAEEDEGSSGEDVGPGKLVMHNNRAASRSVATKKRPASTTPAKPSPLGVPSINARSRPLSTTFGGSAQNGGQDSEDEGPAYGAGGRRAMSDVGGMAYHPPTGRQPLRRTFSEDQPANNDSPAAQRAPSDSSSIRNKPKKKGFMASLSKFFKGSSKRRGGSITSGRDSPPYGSASTGGAWHTRTDSNIKRQGTLTGGKRRGGDDSSSEEEAGNLVSVANKRNSNFSVENVGRGAMRSSSTPVASGLIPSKPTRSDLGANRRGDSQTTLIAAKPGSVRATSPVPSRAKTPTAGASLSRSNTSKSAGTTKSAGVAKSTSAVRSNTVTKKTRQNGSISAAALSSQQAAEGRNIMNLVDLKTPPTMPDVPKAPKSQVSPQMELAKAPGSSLVTATLGASTSPGAPRTVNADATSQPARPISRASSVKQMSPNEVARPNTSLPPSRSLQAPLKSALRPLDSTSVISTSGMGAMPSLSPPIEAPKTLYHVSAPAPVWVPREPVKPAMINPAPAAPLPIKRNSFQSLQSDRESVYESAVDDQGGAAPDESSSEEEGHETGYDVVENESIARSGLVVGPPAVEKIPMRQDEHVNDAPMPTIDSAIGKNYPPAPASDAGSRMTSRKSVRMNVPDSPTTETARPAPPPTNDGPSVDREPSPPPEKNQEEWSTRIGRMREDTSDEEDRDEGYTRARKGLSKNSGVFQAVKGDGKSKTPSLKSRSSAKGSLKGSGKKL